MDWRVVLVSRLDSVGTIAQHITPQTVETLEVGRPLRHTSDPISDFLSEQVLQNGDVLKVDIGVHVKGRILDSAFTLTFDPTYEKLLEAVKAATDTGVRVRQINSVPPSISLMWNDLFAGSGN